jgi:SWIM zinc finger
MMEETAILALAPSADVFDSGAALVSAGALKALCRTPDGTLIFARCDGSGKAAYEVAADLSPTDPPRCTCNCPSRVRPCKHSLALLVAFARSAASFVEAEAPPELIAKRKPKKAPAEPKAKADKAKPAKPNKAAQEKKIAAQLEGLVHAERALADLATIGLGALDQTRLASLRERARDLADFHLPGVALAMRRLVELLSADLPDDAKRASGARLIAQLWTMIKKGRAVLETKDDESAAETDAVVEELLGRVWQLAELKEKGFVRAGVRLYELAYRRFDDEAREERVETSYLYDLDTHAIHRDVQYVPSRRVGKHPTKPSYTGVISAVEAAIYPGFANRRIRWEAEALSETAPTAEARALVIEHALPVRDAVQALQAQRKNLLAPDTIVVAAQVAGVELAERGGFLEDRAGTRLAFATDEASLSALASLQLAGWPADAAAFIVELTVDEKQNTIAARPLTVLSAQGALRLSL